MQEKLVLANQRERIFFFMCPDVVKIFVFCLFTTVQTEGGPHSEYTTFNT